MNCKYETEVKIYNRRNKNNIENKIKKETIPKHTLISEKNSYMCYRTYREDKFKIISKTREEETYGFLAYNIYFV